MPTSIKGQAWLQRSSRWKGKPFRGNREVSWRISQPFLLCNKKNKKKNEAGAQPDLMGFTNKHLRSDPIDLT
jgi:hypothetical protein